MSCALPDFDGDGLLPPGDYPVTLGELLTSHLVSGDGVLSTNWDRPWRQQLVENLGVLAGQLWKAGVSRIYIDGSFVEDKDHPNDIDGYFECDLAELASGRLQRALNRQDPHKVWIWDRTARRADPNSTKKQLPMWHIYHVELYPHTPGKGSGIIDDMGHELEFPSAFRRTRSSGRPKGIVELRQGGTRLTTKEKRAQ